MWSEKNPEATKVICWLHQDKHGILNIKEYLNNLDELAIQEENSNGNTSTNGIIDGEVTA
jgi:hypothetical protein